MVGLGNSLWLALALSTSVQGTPLLGGRFDTTTNVQSLLNLALDAADMKEAESLTVKKSVYENGVARSNDAGELVTLQSLSLNAKDVMAGDPMYNIFRHAFLELGVVDEGETQGFFDQKPVEQYGDTLVNDLFSLDAENIETEAAIVTIVWMAVQHELYQVMQQCKAGDKTKGLAALDRAAALWIGEGQQEGSSDGHLLYSLTEDAGERFDQDDEETEVNTQIIDRFVQMQNSLMGNSCDNLAGYLAMRDDVKAMTGLMTVPLIQKLIHHTLTVQNEQGSNFVELYALATIPRVAACDPDAYSDELKLDVLRELTPNLASQSIAAFQRAYSCLGITCEQVGAYLGGTLEQCVDPVDVTAAGYTSSRDGARKKSYLDRDIKQIDVFLRFEALGAALDWYQHGWNSDVSLQALATNQVVPQVSGGSYIDLFSSYYQEQNFGDSLIINVLEMVPPYNSASKEQVRNLVVGMLKNVVVFTTSASSLQYALDRCDTDTAAALSFWDTGALYFVGSMEGEASPGTEFGGEFLFTTAKELCPDFNTCVSGTAAAANELILSGLKQAVSSITSKQCDVVKGLLESQILPGMSVPIIQGTVKYASLNAALPADSDDKMLAIGDTFARALRPLVDDARPASASAIETQMQFQRTSKPVPNGFSAVADAVKQALPSMSTPCVDIGQYVDEPSYNLCLDGGGGVTPSPVAQPTLPPVEPGNIANLAFGRYTFSDLNVAEGDSAFALDIRDMFQASGYVEGQRVYEDGANALSSGLSGQPGTTSVQALSREAATVMIEDPLYNYYRYALYDDEDLEDDSGQDFPFADDTVTTILEGPKDNMMAAEAAVILNVWMVIVHQLYEAVSVCRNEENPVKLIDSAVALWIGQEQAEGKYDHGWMIYSIAQSSSQFFGFTEGESKINRHLMDKFNELQSVANTCPTSPTALATMYTKVAETIRELTKPLILTLLYHMALDNKLMVELYAVAVVPQAIACNEDIGEDLLDALFYSYDREDSMTEEVLDDLASFLRCQRFIVQDLAHGATVDDDLRSLVSQLSTRLDYYLDASTYMPIVGYIPDTDVNEYSRLDLDALEIYILTRTKASRAALDVYELGHNAYSYENEEQFMSLKQLATSSERESSLQYQLFTDWFGTSNYADDIIQDTLEESDDYELATRGERSEIVSRTIQTMISYMMVVTKMQMAVKSCNEGSMQNAQLYWDTAVALYVGSVEGLLPGGLEDGEAEFMYALANEVCEDFDNCEPAGESTVNQMIMFEFSAGKDAIQSNQCGHLSRTMTWELLPRMAIPLVQGTMTYAIENSDEDERNSDSLGTAHVFAMSVMPLVDNVNATSAATLDDYFGSFDEMFTGEPVDDVMEAFSYALRGMGIDCADLGTSIDTGLSFCLDSGGNDPDGGSGDGGNVPDQAPVSDTPTDLADGLYVTTTYVQDRANIALDVKDLEEALGSGNTGLAELMYEDGKNSDVYDLNGKFVSLRNLKSFSTEETLDMLDEPLFNVYMYALQDSNGKFMSRDARLYADSLVEDAFSKATGNNKLLPVEAAVSLNVWMHIAHLLYKTLKDCKDKKIRDSDGVHSMDIAVAYWIGDGQIAGNGEAGHLLYAMSERMGEVFNIDDGGQSRTNTNILKLFNEAKHEISLPGACSDSPASYLRISRIVNRILSLMSVPLIQSLIHNMRMDDIERVKLYAHAVTPLVAGCSPSAYSLLKNKLLSSNYNVAEIENIIASLREIYPCLGLTCDDIGLHETEVTNTELSCTDPPVFATLAGYKPATDVREYSRLDLDLRQLDILLQMKAYDAAENLYTYGKNVKGQHGGSLSLSQIATTSERSTVPEYDAFVRYFENSFGNPSTYADTMIRSALDGSGSWTDAQRRVVVLKSAQVMVMYFGVLQSLYEAISDCQSSASMRATGSSELWDKGAALLIGSLEGSMTNGTAEGYMYYDLAQEHCGAFGTCQKDNTGVAANDQLVTLLYTGRGAILSNGCSALKKAADEISSLMLVPVIQGALSAAIELSSTDDASSSIHKAEGYVYSRAVLPLVADADRNAATMIDANLGLPGPSSTKHTASEVFSSFAKTYNSMGVDCEMVGQSKGTNACTGVVEESDDGKLLWIIIGAAVAVSIFCCCLVGLRSSKEAKLPENNPKFTPSAKGELNHSMDLLEKAFSTNTRPRTSPQNSEVVGLTEDMHNDASAIDEDDFEEATALKSSMVGSKDII